MRPSCLKIATDLHSLLSDLLLERKPQLISSVAEQGIMSRSGSRYQSAFGHTPSYRSYVRSGLDSSAPTSSAFSSGLGSAGLGSSTGSTGFNAYGSGPGYDLSLPSASFDLGLSTSGLGSAGGSGSSSKAVQKVSNYSYSSSSNSAVDGGRPVVEYSKESNYKASATGPSGIPRSSVAHSSSSYSSEDPYKNRVSNYSYNI